VLLTPRCYGVKGQLLVPVRVAFGQSSGGDVADSQIPTAHGSRVVLEASGQASGRTAR